jgi:hypothetical protein
MDNKESTKMSCSKVFDPRRYRAFFAENWSRFLRANYRNAEEVAVVYSVRYQTALNWWNGDNQPSGYAVAIASQSHADSFKKHMGMAA